MSNRQSANSHKSVFFRFGFSEMQSALFSLLLLFCCGRVIYIYIYSQRMNYVRYYSQRMNYVLIKRASQKSIKGALDKSGKMNLANLCLIDRKNALMHSLLYSSLYCLNTLHFTAWILFTLLFEYSSLYCLNTLHFTVCMLFTLLFVYSSLYCLHAPHFTVCMLFTLLFACCSLYCLYALHFTFCMLFTLLFACSSLCCLHALHFIVCVLFALFSTSLMHSPNIKSNFGVITHCLSSYNSLFFISLRLNAHV